MPRLNLTDDETRDLILEQSVRLIGEFGAQKTTVADIADACGFSSANVHRIFGTKADIRLAVCDRMLTRRTDVMREAVDAADGARAKLRAFVEAVHGDTRSAFDHHPRMHDMVAIAVEERWAPVTAFRVRLLETAREIVRLGIETGEFDVPDPDRAAMGLHMGTFRLFHPMMVEETKGAPDEGSVDDFFDFAVRGLGGASSGRRRAVDA